MRRLAVATLTVLVALAVTIPSVLATWPTTCVEANDAFEYAAGRHANVGIYQRVTASPEAAEAACRHDHGHAVQQAFGWAFQSSVPPPPRTVPADPRAHPDYRRVWEAAFARSDAVLAGEIAASVIQRGTVDAFLRGEDGGVVYGRYRCDWQSVACPLAPVYVPPSPPAEPRIAADLQPAWDLLAGIEVGRLLMDFGRASTVRVRVGDDPPPVGGRYRTAEHTIYINRWLFAERPSVVVSILAHELWHAVSWLPDDQSFTACIAEEVWGALVGSTVWLYLEPSPMPNATVTEQNLTYVANLILDGSGAMDFDTDTQDWPRLTLYVLEGYTASCSH